jgi:hypothetical protein
MEQVLSCFMVRDIFPKNMNSIYQITITILNQEKSLLIEYPQSVV